ncbi:MAG: hypothetical protein AB1635_13370 [Acidobacteriota bacterium]
MESRRPADDARVRAVVAAPRNAVTPPLARGHALERTDLVLDVGIVEVEPAAVRLPCGRQKRSTTPTVPRQKS